VEYEQAIRIQQQLAVTLTRAEPARPYDWIDQSGVTYDAIGGFPGKYFKWTKFQEIIDTHLEKADLVPIDVSNFDLSQTSSIIQYIQQFHGRAFILGDG
jgi:hypothetical protein